MIETASGLPMTLDAGTGELSFHGGLICDGSSQKQLGQMTGLFRDADGADENATVYRAYRNIRFPADEALFAGYDYRYDITVVLPGSLNGEFFKTSGHLHACPPLARVPFPEVYEVVQGEIVFVLQRNETYKQTDGGRITRLQAVHVKAGQSIIVPPYCGHGSVNPTNAVAAFSNIAVVSCPLDYEPVRRRHGLGAYILRGDGQGRGFVAVPNGHYDALPAIEIAEPVENPELGIEFGQPCYHTFIEHPSRYDFLLHPERYMDEIDRMTRTVTVGEERENEAADRR